MPISCEVDGSSTDTAAIKFDAAKAGLEVESDGPTKFEARSTTGWFPYLLHPAQTRQNEFAAIKLFLEAYGNAVPGNVTPESPFTVIPGESGTRINGEYTPRQAPLKEAKNWAMNLIGMVKEN